MNFSAMFAAKFAILCYVDVYFVGNMLVLWHRLSLNNLVE